MSLPERIVTEKVIPVARGLDAGSAPRLAEALRKGGLTTLEITMEGDSGLAAIEATAGGDTLVGAGTVLAVPTAQRAVEAGASFIVSPHFEPDLVAWAATEDVPVVPGAFTPTEVANAWRLGPAAIKIFPANMGGPDHVRSLLGPYPDIVLIPTGGVSASNIADFLGAGAVAVGVGGWLTAHDDLAVVTQRAKQLVEQVV